MEDSLTIKFILLTLGVIAGIIFSVAIKDTFTKTISQPLNLVRFFHEETDGDQKWLFTFESTHLFTHGDTLLYKDVQYCVISILYYVDRKQYVVNATDAVAFNKIKTNNTWFK